MFFDNWSLIINILVTGSLTYVALIIMLRLSGKRTLAQMNAFDFIVTVALGSTLATTLLAKDTLLAEGLAGLGSLIVLPFVLSWIYVRVPFLTGLLSRSLVYCTTKENFKIGLCGKSE